MTLAYPKLSITQVKHAASNTSMIGKLFKDCITRLETFFVRLAFVKFLPYRCGFIMRLLGGHSDCTCRGIVLGPKTNHDILEGSLFPRRELLVVFAVSPREVGALSKGKKSTQLDITVTHGTTICCIIWDTFVLKLWNQYFNTHADASAAASAGAALVAFFPLFPFFPLRGISRFLRSRPRELSKIVSAHSTVNTGHVLQGHRMPGDVWPTCLPFFPSFF